MTLVFCWNKDLFSWEFIYIICFVLFFLHMEVSSGFWWKMCTIANFVKPVMFKCLIIDWKYLKKVSKSCFYAWRLQLTACWFWEWIWNTVFLVQISFCNFFVTVWNCANALYRCWTFIPLVPSWENGKDEDIIFEQARFLGHWLHCVSVCVHV